MNRQLEPATDLEALFDIEMDGRVEAANVQQTWGALQCWKCKGGGKFIGYAGKTLGDCFACKGTGLRPAADVEARAARSAAIDASKISAAFAAAFSNGIKRPKVRLGGFTFSRAPDHGKNAGSIYVKRGEDYLGKVTGGQFHGTRECDDAAKASIVTIAADPALAAKAYGLRTGSCSCCGRELTNADSIALGIGPICAERFGW